jgi:hypothetical protein
VPDCASIDLGDTPSLLPSQMEYEFCKMVAYGVYLHRHGAWGKASCSRYDGSLSRRRQSEYWYQPERHANHKLFKTKLQFSYSKGEGLDSHSSAPLALCPRLLLCTPERHRNHSLEEHLTGSRCGSRERAQRCRLLLRLWASLLAAGGRSARVELDTKRTKATDVKAMPPPISMATAGDNC